MDRNWEFVGAVEARLWKQGKREQWLDAFADAIGRATRAGRRLPEVLEAAMRDF